MNLGSRNAIYVGAVCAAASAALFFSFYKLSESPSVWYDEGFYSQVAENVSLGKGSVLQVEPGKTIPASTAVTVGYPLIYPVAASYLLFGVGVLQGRVVMALFILGFLAGSYVLVRRLHGRDTAAFSLLLLATFPVLYGNGKSVLGEVPGMFYLTLAFLSLHALERSGYKSHVSAVFSGLFAGLCMATKPEYILLVPALGLVLLLFWRKIVPHWKNVLLAIGAALAPMVLWFYIQFASSDSFGSVIAFYANPYEITNLSSVVTHNALRFLTEASPLYLFVTLLIWGITLISRVRDKNISAVEVAAFVFSLAVILSFLRTPGWYRYFFPAQILGLLFFVPSLFYLTEKAVVAVPRVRNLRAVLIAGVMLLAAGQLYQLSNDSYVARYYHSARTKTLTDGLARLDPTQSVFLYNTPEVAVFLPHQNYFQYIAPHENQLIGGEEIENLRKGIPHVVIVSTGAELKKPELFSGYRKKTELSRYTVLERI